MRWLRPPPQRTAYFCARRRPGIVLRVSRIVARVPATARTYAAVVVAVEESVCRKLSALRSPETSARALPSSVQSVAPASTASPSPTRQPIVAVPSSAWKHASNHAVPAIVAASFATIAPCARRSAGSSVAVASPLPMSSASARATSLATTAGSGGSTRFTLAASSMARASRTRACGSSREVLQLRRADALLGQHHGNAVVDAIDHLAVGGDEPLAERRRDGVAVDVSHLAARDLAVERGELRLRHRGDGDFRDRIAEDLDQAAVDRHGATLRSQACLPVT